MLSVEPNWITSRGLCRLTKAQWIYRQTEIAEALDEVWTHVYTNEAGIPMVPTSDSQDRIVVRETLHTLSARAAVACILRLLPWDLALTLAIRPSRAERDAVGAGHRGDGDIPPAFRHIPLDDVRIAATQEWTRIIHVIIAQRANCHTST